MTYWAVDPGLTGAAALIHDAGVEILDWPGDEVAAADALRWWLEIYGTPTLAVIEQQQAMGGDKFHTSSMFKLAANYGAWLGILGTLKIPVRQVLPARWKRGYVPAKSPKEASLAVARRLFPAASLDRKKDHNRADALLLADYARRLHLGEIR